MDKTHVQNDHIKFTKTVSAPIHHHRRLVFQRRNLVVMAMKIAGVNGQNGMFVRLSMKEDVMGHGWELENAVGSVIEELHVVVVLAKVNYIGRSH